MRIITWNCLGANFQEKKEAILKLKPDVLVVQECEPLEKLIFAEGLTGQDRIGDEGQLRGLAVLCFNGFRLERLDGHNPDLKFFLPLRVFKDNLSLTLLATWVWHKDSSQYLDVFSAAVDHYAEVLNREKMLFLGDLNTPGAENNLASPTAGNRFLERHLEIVGKLSQKGVKSLFHAKNNVEHGKEKKEDATLYHNSDPSKPFHCDYVFASDDMLKRLQFIEIGKPVDWLKLSDHMPLIVDFDL